MSITKAINQTKNWRQIQPWWKGGKKSECEIYQRGIVETITGSKCHKTNTRIHLFRKELVEMTCPNKHKDGFEYTENFDGKQIRVNNKEIYYNFKMICDKGGAQTRSLQLVYFFIQAQLQFLYYSPKTNNVYFANILDGDESARHKDKFEYLLSQYPSKNVYCGDLKDFKEWISKID